MYSKMVPSEEDIENGKSKTPNLNRLIKARLEKLVSKADETCVVPFFAVNVSCAQPLCEVDEFYQMNSCNCPRRKYGPFTTRKSKDLNASKTFLCDLFCHLLILYLTGCIETN